MVWLAIYGGMKFEWFFDVFYGNMVNVSIGKYTYTYLYDVTHGSYGL